MQNAAFVEYVDNFAEYFPFLDIASKDYFTSLRRYVLERRYNLQFVDLASVILASASNININILDEEINVPSNSHNTWITIIKYTDNSYRKMIVIMQLSHYAFPVQWLSCLSSR